MRAHTLPLIALLGACTVVTRAPDSRTAADTAAAHAPAPPADLSTGTHVVLLGTGTPNPDTARFGPAVAIVVNGEPYLVDAGAGVVRRAVAAGIPVTKLRRVFLTHLHSDHTIGMADLLLTPWVLERTAPLEVYGPARARDLMTHLTAAYDADIRRRIDGLQPQNETGWRSVVTPLREGVVYRDSLVTVSAIPVPHEEWDEAWGFKFETADRTIVVSGDTRWSDALIAACNGCDVLVYEVYSDAGFARRTPEWQRYHRIAHIGAADLGRLASQARPGLLVLYHQLHMGVTDAELLAEVRATFSGRVVSGRDLGVY